MATNSWHGKSGTADSPQDIARRGTVAKRGGPAPIHDGMASQTRGKSLGGPTQGNPPDASSPLPTDPSRQGKSFPLPAVTFGMKGKHDPGLAAAIMAEAYHGPADFARDLHTALPDKPSE